MNDRRRTARRLSLALSLLACLANAQASNPKAVGVTGVSIAPSSLTTVEDGQTVRYRVVLDMAPAAGETVTITPISNDQTEGTVSGALVFDENNWNVPQYVTVTPGASGDGNDGDVAYAIDNQVATTGGAFTSGFASGVYATNYNIDGIATIKVDRSSGFEVSEDGTVAETITISAGSDVTPSSDVIVALINNDPGLVSLSTPSVTLNAGNGYSATVSIWGIANDTFDGYRPFSVTTGPATSADVAFNGAVPDIAGYVVDSNVSVGGTLTGLAPGASVTLGADFDLGSACGIPVNAVACAKVSGPTHEDLVLTADGTFQFATALRPGNSFSVDVTSQPNSPPQVCTVTERIITKAVTGTVGSGSYYQLQVDCVTPTFSVGGTVSGLADGTTLVLRNSYAPPACLLGTKACKVVAAGEDDLSITANGSFSFPVELAPGDTYSVDVLTQPSAPNQSCVLSRQVPGKAETGTIVDHDITDLLVTCTTLNYTVGGVVTGLVGSGLQLQNNGGDTLDVAADGSFVFPTALPDGSTFAVSILTQPTSPTQNCSIGVAPARKGMPGTGTINGSNVNWIGITCDLPDYAIRGTLTGLASGNSVILRNTYGALPVACKTGGTKACGKTAGGSEDLELTADGSFAFATRLPEGTAFSVDVLTQPTTPNQTCIVTGAPIDKVVSGTVGSGDVNYLQVTCTTITYAVGGSISGLDGGSVVLQLNGGDDLTVSANGTFAFTTELDDGSDYTVSVLTQPSVPSPGQTCVVGNGSGTLAGTAVGNVAVTCSNDATPPGAPLDVTASFSGGGVIVNWTPPADDGGSPITGYTVTLQPGGATCTVTGTPPPTTCTIPGVPPGSYAVEVVASNAAGAGGAGAGGLNPAAAAPEVIPATSEWTLALLAAMTLLLAGLALRRTTA